MIRYANDDDDVDESTGTCEGGALPRPDDQHDDVDESTRTCEGGALPRSDAQQGLARDDERIFQSGTEARRTHPMDWPGAVVQASSETERVGSTVDGGDEQGETDVRKASRAVGGAWEWIWRRGIDGDVRIASKS